MTEEEIETARRAARAMYRGEQVSDAEMRLVIRAEDYLGPESFYMDGELFSDGF